MDHTVNSIADLRLLAKRWVPRGIFEYADGGVCDEITLTQLAQNRCSHVMGSMP